MNGRPSNQEMYSLMNPDAWSGFRYSYAAGSRAPYTSLGRKRCSFPSRFPKAMKSPVFTPS
jgi:hypothetical protein